MRNLIICSSREQLEKIVCTCDGECYIGTSNIVLYLQLKQENANIYFLEPEESYPYEIFWNMLDKVSAVVSRCNLHYSYLYKLDYNVDGVASVFIEKILYINLMDAFIKEHGIKKIYLVDDKINWRIAEAVYLISCREGLECHIWDEAISERKEKLYTLRNLGLSIAETGGLDGQKIVKEYAQRERHVRQDNVEYHEMGIPYLRENDGKHFTWICKDIEKFSREFKIRVICFHHSEDENRFLKRQIETDCLEDFFDENIFRNEVSEFISDLYQIYAHLSRDLSIVYRNLDLSAYITLKVMNYYRNMIEHIYFNHCTKQYFLIHKYGLIRGWGRAGTWENVIVYANTRDAETKLFRREENCVTYPKVNIPTCNVIQIHFSPSIENQERVIDKRYHGKIFHSFDTHIGDDFYKGMNLYPYQEIGNKLIRILYAPSYPWIGFRTKKHFLETSAAIIQGLRGRNCKIIFKNHGCLEDDLETEVYKVCQCENMEVIDKRKPIYDVLPQCDIVIASVSTVLFDSAVYQKPVLCIAGNSEYEYIKSREEGFMIYQETESVLKQLYKILDNHNMFEEYCKNIINRQNEYMKKMLGEYDADAIDKMNRILRSEMQEKK